nr:DUF975 family protein [uncultured Blautia sp.]
MIGNRRYWKACAKQFLSGKWGIAILAMMAAPALNTIGTMAAIKLFPGDSFLAWLLGEAFLFIVPLLSMVISTGYNFMLLNMARGREYRFGNLIYMFKKGSDGVLSAALIMALIDTVLMIPFYYMVNMTAPAAETMEAVLEWSQPIMYSALAATVLGVVIKLPFAMAFYILADNPQMKGREALKKSASLMKGHMMQYLVLQISFIPLIFLSILFLYVGLLWVMPYIYATNTIFYMDVTGELKETHKKHMHEVADWIPKELEDTAADKELQEQRTGDDYNSEA